MSVRASNEDTEILAERKDAVVLEKYLSLQRSLICELRMSLAAKLWIVLKLCIRLIEESETELQTENATYSVINTLHRHFTLLNKFLEIDGELAVIWNHRHVDTGIDRKLHRFLEA